MLGYSEPREIWLLINGNNHSVQATFPYKKMLGNNKASVCKINNHVNVIIKNYCRSNGIIGYDVQLLCDNSIAKFYSELHIFN